MSDIVLPSPANSTAKPDAKAFPVREACASCAHRHGPVCRALRADPVMNVHPPRPLLLRKDQPLPLKLERTGTMALVKSGYLRFERMCQDGRRNILGLAVPGDLVGSWSGTGAQCEIEAASEVELCVMSAPLIRTMTERSEAFRLQVLREAARQHIRQLDLVYQRGALSSRERIIAFLLMAIGTMPTHYMSDGSVVVTIKVSRRDWADLANSSVETISRTLSELSRQGLVKSVSPGAFRIEDPARLSLQCGFERDTYGIPDSMPFDRETQGGRGASLLRLGNGSSS